MINICLFDSVFKSSQNVKLEGKRGERFHIKLIWALSFDIPKHKTGYKLKDYKYDTKVSEILTVLPTCLL
jgi:hypothetical protein